MPKIIGDIRGKLLAETKKQIIENGYSALNIRSVASACGVGVGTVYNYFDSKNSMIASFMIEDWQNALSTIYTNDKSELMHSIYLVIRQFIKDYSALFNDEHARKLFRVVSEQYHPVLRSQIARFIAPAFEETTLPDVPFASEFAAESILSWAVAGKEYEDISPILSRMTK